MARIGRHADRRRRAGRPGGSAQRPAASGPRLGPGRGRGHLGGALADLERARPGRLGSRRRLPGDGPRAGRPDRLADAEPGRPVGPLPGLLPGRGDRDAAQLPLHRARDRPRARGERGPGRCSPTSSGPRTSPASSSPPASNWARSPTATPSRSTPATRSPSAPAIGWRHEFARAARSRAARAPTPRSRIRTSPAVIFFTSGSTGPAKGVTHTRDTLRWMIASAAGAFELDSSDVFLPGSSMSHIGSFLWALAMLSVGGEGGRGAEHRRPRAAAAAARPAADGPGDDPGGALGPDPRPRSRSPATSPRCASAAPGPTRSRPSCSTEFAEMAGFPIVEGYGMTEVGLATLNPPSGEIRQGSIGTPICGFTHRAARRGRRADRGRRGRPDLDPHPQPDGRLLAGAGGDRAGRHRRLARLGRPRPRRRRRLPVVLRPQEAGDRPRRLQHQPVRGRGRPGRAPRGRPRRRRRGPRRGPRRERPRLRDPGGGRRAALARRPDRLLPRSDRLQGAGGDRLPRRDAAQPDRQDRPGGPEADGRGPPPPARARRPVRAARAARPGRASRHCPPVSPGSRPRRRRRPPRRGGRGPSPLPRRARPLAAR